MPKRSKNIKSTDSKKAWNKRKPKKQPYKIESRNKIKTFLIVCEGQNTEPQYFKSFPVITATVKSYGYGSTKTKLVKDVLKIVKDEKDVEQEVWVVFDMDIRTENTAQQKEDYENAIQLAEAKGLNVAYSNDAFELWFLLHYQYFDSQWKRHEYYKRLSDLWNCNYENDGKNIRFCRMIYKRLKEDSRADQAKAIENAKKLFNNQKDQRLSEKNPSTKIYQLVENLNEYI